MRIRLYRTPRGLASLADQHAREIAEHLALDTSTYPGGRPHAGDVVVDPRDPGLARRPPRAERLYEIDTVYLAPAGRDDTPAPTEWEVRATVRVRAAHDHETLITGPPTPSEPQT